MLITSFLSATLDAAGTVLIAYTALRVHDRVQRERIVDAQVTTEMKREQQLGIVGIAFILCGYALHVIGLISLEI